MATAKLVGHDVAPSGVNAATNASTPVVVGWNTITIPSVSVNLGTAYWLAFNSG